jgi:prepilin-type processing-associated H-X9-DG protein
VETFDTHSTFTQLLPFLDFGPVHDQFDLQYPYNDAANAPSNPLAAKSVVPSYLCPANPVRPKTGQDSLGYGYTDYAPIGYVDIEGQVGVAGVANNPIRNATTPNAVAGALKVGGSSSASYRDGTSNTVSFMEVVGRSEDYYLGNHTDPVGTDLLPAGSTRRNPWRWAEPASAIGVSGPPGAKFGQSRMRILNNTSGAPGGPATCPWTVPNCGANDEPFGFPGGGVNTLFMDAHVTLLKEDIDPVVLRRLLTPLENLPIADASGRSFSEY